MYPSAPPWLVKNLFVVGVRGLRAVVEGAQGRRREGGAGLGNFSFLFFFFLGVPSMPQSIETLLTLNKIIISYRFMENRRVFTVCLTFWFSESRILQSCFENVFAPIIARVKRATHDMPDTPLFPGCRADEQESAAAWERESPGRTSLRAEAQVLPPHAPP